MNTKTQSGCCAGEQVEGQRSNMSESTKKAR